MIVATHGESYKPEKMVTKYCLKMNSQKNFYEDK